MPDSIRCGVYFKSASRSLPVETFLKTIGHTRLDASPGPQKGKQTYWFASVAEFDRLIPGIIESVGRGSMHIPIPVVQDLLELVASEAEAEDHAEAGCKHAESGEPLPARHSLFFRAGHEITRLRKADAAAKELAAQEAAAQEYAAGAALANEGRPLPDGASDAARLGHAEALAALAPEPPAETDQSQGSAAVERRTHNPEVAGSNPAPATPTEDTALPPADNNLPVPKPVTPAPETAPPAPDANLPAADSAPTGHEVAGTAHDPDARGHELAGRAPAPAKAPKRKAGRPKKKSK